MKDKIKITRDYVAKLAGVAPSTVSAVINNKGYVSEELRARVNEAIEKSQYTPNLIARSLMTNSSKHIGLILDEITNPHFSELAKGAHLEATNKGYILSIGLSTQDNGTVIDDYISRNTDGIIYNVYTKKISDTEIKKLKNKGICLVTTSLEYGDICLTINYYDGMKKVYKYLMELGHSEIAFIFGLSKDDEAGRLIGYKWCCENIGNGYYENKVVFGREPYATDYKAGYDYMNELMSRNLKFTAVIVANDYMAIGVLKALRELGKKVPEDISIISFDNTVYSEASVPALTSIGASAFEIGQTAVKSIIDIKEKKVANNVIINHNFEMELVIRDSTKKIT